MLFHQEQEDGTRVQDSLETIFEKEEMFLDSEKPSGLMTLAILKTNLYDAVSYVGCCVRPTTFLQHSYLETLYYCWYHSLVFIQRPVLELVKIHVSEQGELIPIKKTRWLKVVQKKWKQVYAERKQEIHRRIRSIEYVRLRELYPRTGFLRDNLPSIHGMLHHLSKDNK
jgi:hypothetical protein